MTAPVPTTWESNLTSRSLRALNLLYGGFFVVAWVLLAWFGEVYYLRPWVFYLAWSVGLAVSVSSLVLARLWIARPPWIRRLALATADLQFFVTVGSLMFVGAGQVLAMGAYLVSASFTLFLAGLFSRRAWIIATRGLAAALGAWVLFGLVPGFFFVRHPSEPVEVMGLVLGFGLAVAAGSVAVTWRLAFTLARQAREAADRLERLAYEDPDTGLPNGRRLEGDLAGAQGHLAPGDRVALVGFRLEGLEALNELRGLEFSGQLLAQMAGELLEGLEILLDQYPSVQAPGSLDRLYRVEGGSFALPLRLPPGFTADPAPLADLIAGVLSSHNRHLPLGRPLKFDGGIVLWPEDSSELPRLTSALLNLLHEAPRTTSGVFLPFDPQAYRDHQRREALKEALVKEVGGPEFSVAFQPRVRVADGRVAGYESLARWTSAAFGVVSPAEFIPLAERLGLLDTLTWAVLDRSAVLIRGLRAQGRTDFRVSLNLSPGLLSPRFLESLLDRCTDTEVARHLELEITEGILMVLDPVVSSLFDLLRDRGVTFAIDDFGSGYSNLAYLQTFRAEVLKIDKQFVDGIPHDPKSTTLVKTIVAMAHAFGMKVVAEGVETVTQKLVVSGAGCDEIQGYWFAKPLFLDQALAYRGPEGS